MLVNPGDFLRKYNLTIIPRLAGTIWFGDHGGRRSLFGDDQWCSTNKEKNQIEWSYTNVMIA